MGITVPQVMYSCKAVSARAFTSALLRKQPMSMATNTPESGRPWLRILVRCLLILVILLAVSGFFYENISEARYRRFHPMPGQLVDVGGYRMHIYCLGQEAPPVILDSGLGDSYVSWSKVQPQ